MATRRLFCPAGRSNSCLLTRHSDTCLSETSLSFFAAGLFLTTESMDAAPPGSASQQNLLAARHAASDLLYPALALPLKIGSLYRALLRLSKALFSVISGPGMPFWLLLPLARARSSLLATLRPEPGRDPVARFPGHIPEGRRILSSSFASRSSGSS